MTNENNPNLTEMIREIHDGVAREMYCKGIDDFAEHIRTYYALKQEMGYVATTYKDLINYIFELAEQLKAGKDNANKI